jgi:hypothetical protein
MYPIWLPVKALAMTRGMAIQMGTWAADARVIPSTNNKLSPGRNDVKINAVSMKTIKATA